MTNRLTCLLITLAISTLGLAQQRPGSGNWQAPKIGTVSGKIMDRETGLPLEFATVTILSAKDSSLLTGASTDLKGKFTISEIAAGPAILKAEFIGYATYYSDVFVIDMKNPYHQFNDLSLGLSSTILEAVEITEQKPLIVNQLDKKVYDVSQDIANEGVDGLRMLENIPSVEVDIEGTITLRGGENVRILIDGRPSAFSASDLLQQMPASSIERVEIITNPSAKFNPEGTSGILNIITKKNKAFGFTGNFNANAGYGRTPKYGGGLGLNLKNQKVNLYTNLGYNNREFEIRGETSTESPTDPDIISRQDNVGFRNFRNYSIRTGVDYFLNPNNILYTSFTYNDGARDNDQDVDYLTIEDDFDILDSRRLTDNTGDNQGWQLNGGWQKKFGNPDHTLDLDLSYSTNESDNQNDFEQIFYDDEGNIIPPLNKQRQISINENSTFNVRLDYVRPMLNDAVLEAGLSYDGDEVDENFTGLIYDRDEDIYVEDPNTTNHFVYNQDVIAAYGTFGDKRGPFSYKFGLRAEQTYMNSDLLTTGETFTNNYFSLFPSAFLGYELNESNEIQISYSRRISRPRTRQLNPFTNFADPRNLRRGNPFLDPEFAHIVELSHQKIWDKFSVNTTAFYQKIQDEISRFLDYREDGVTISTYENIGESNRYGLELIASYRPFKWWTLSVDGDFSYQKFTTVTVESTLNQENNRWSLRLTSRKTLPKGFSVQMDARYRGKRQVNQGIIEPMYGINLGVRKSLLDRKLNLSLNIRDIFNWYEFNFIASDNQALQQERRFKWESQVFTFSLSYNFGTPVKGPQRKRNRRDRGDYGNDNDMDM